MPSLLTLLHLVSISQQLIIFVSVSGKVGKAKRYLKLGELPAQAEERKKTKVEVLDLKKFKAMKAAGEDVEDAIVKIIEWRD